MKIALVESYPNVSRTPGEQPPATIFWGVVVKVDFFWGVFGGRTGLENY